MGKQRYQHKVSSPSSDGPVEDLGWDLGSRRKDSTVGSRKTLTDVTKVNWS